MPDPAGLRQLRQALSPDSPPTGIAKLLGIRVDKLEVGEAVFSLEPNDLMTNPLGSVHGGILSTLLDSALSCAVHSTLDAGQRYTTLDLDVRFVRAVLPQSGRISASGAVVHRGRRTATAEGRLHDEHGRLVAHATAGCLVMTEG